MNKDIIEALGSDDEVEAVLACCCPMCKCSIPFEGFRDKQSISEFMISGLCQRCQDKIFVDED